MLFHAKVCLITLCLGSFTNLEPSISAQGGIKPIVLLSESSPSPSPSPSPNSSLSTAIGRQLLGQWEWKDPSSGQPLTYIFGQGNKLFIIYQPSSGPFAVETTYSLNLNNKPVAIDLIFGKNQVVKTIIEVTKGQLRMQQAAINSQTRPNSFTSDAMSFQKTSNLTKPPKNTRIIKF